MPQTPDDLPAAPPDAALSREARLAAKLRENLHRRKAQTREQLLAEAADKLAALSKPPQKS
jgi:hypothetical protein